MLQHIFLYIQYFFLLFLTIQVGYLLIFSFAALFSNAPKFPPAQLLRRIKILIPGYKEDAVIIATAIDALNQNYPIHLFEIVIIADSFSVDTLNKLRSLPIKVIEVKFEKSTKGKALQKALEILSINAVEIVIVLDADNHMAQGFLHEVNNAFAVGYEVVQGHRTAKNKENSFAFLDACTEEINNHIFRRGHNALGLPSALIGSGMAFDWKLFASLMHNISDTAGEDKEMEFRIIRQGKNIIFLDGAYIYDEKVHKSQVFSKQRSRWLAVQAEYFTKYFLEGWRQLLKGNFSFFEKTFQMYLLPRVILVGLINVWLLCTILFFPHLIIYTICLVVSLAVSLFLGIPIKWFNKQLLLAFLQIPSALFSMLRAMVYSGKAKKTFIHTPHGEIN